MSSVSVAPCTRWILCSSRVTTPLTSTKSPAPNQSREGFQASPRTSPTSMTSWSSEVSVSAIPACTTVCYFPFRGPPFNLQGGGAGVFVADKLFISTRLGSSLKILNCITCLYRTVLKVNYLFHESPRKLNCDLFTTKLLNLNFHSLEVVSLWRASRLKVREIYWQNGCQRFWWMSCFILTRSKAGI